MKVISLSSLIEAAEEREVTNYLSSFSCARNQEVERFLHHKAIENEQRSFTRTSIVIDDNNPRDIIGYFTLMMKNFEFADVVSRSTRKRLTNDKKATVMNTILIAQLGRSDAYKGKVPGKEILEHALVNCGMVHDLVGMRIVCVEFDPIPYLRDFYLSKGFEILQQNPSGKILAYIRI